MIPAGATVVDIGAGHGDTTNALLDSGFAVTAIEPVGRMRRIGKQAAPRATWTSATGEATRLDPESVDAVVSSFGSMYCDPVKGPAEWDRILRPDGALVMAVFTDEGFQATMTNRMMEIFSPKSSSIPPHVLWGRPEVARDRLVAHFHDIALTERTMNWDFDGVEAGMDFYLHGSPVHAWSLHSCRSTAQRDNLLAALRDYLAEHVDADGHVRAQLHYCVISAIRHRR